MKKFSLLILVFCFAFPVLSQQAQEAKHPTPLGKLVDIGGYRLHIHCQGKGSPTVVLIAGSGDFSFDWRLIQSKVAHFAKVCSYDRAGLAWSDLGPVPRTMRQEVYELHELLAKTKWKGSYLLVGHSIGGLLARLYAEQYPREVAGLILIDSTTDDTQLLFQGKLIRVRESATGRPVPPIQTLKSSPPKPPTQEDLKQAELNRQVFGAPKIESPFDKLPADAQSLRLWALNNPKLFASDENFWAEELQAMYQKRTKHKFIFGELPLMVILPEQVSNGDPPQGISKEEWEQVNQEKRKQKMELAALSTNSKVVLAENSGHHIHLDRPDIVVAAIEEMIESIRSRQKLKP